MNNSDFDVVVIGAGNGGLSSALYLLKHGKRVLMLEKNNYPGGCATSIVKGRFEFEASLHEMCFVGSEKNPGPIRRLLEKEYNLNIDWIPVEDVFRAVCNDSEVSFDIVLPIGVVNFINELESHYPGCKESLTEVMEYSRMIYNTLNQILDNIGKNSVNNLLPVDFMKIAHVSCDEMLRNLNVPDIVREIYESYWDYLGVEPTQISFAVYAYMMYSYISDKPWIVRNRSSELSYAFDYEIKKHNGQIWYNAEVVSIVVENNSVRGVKLSDGTIIYTKYVISNVIPHVVFGKMIDPLNVPEREKKLANARSLGACCFVVYLGLDVSFQELGLSSYNIILKSCSDNLKQFRLSKKLETQRDLGIVVLNIVNPDCSPKDTCIIQLTRLFTGDVWRELYSNEERYVEKKELFAESTIQMLEEYLGKKIRDHIEEIVVASPATWARYLGTPYGDIYGYSAVSWDGSFVRVISNKKEDYSIKGLHFAGGHGTQLNGYSQSYLSGKEQAIYVLEEMGLTNE